MRSLLVRLHRWFGLAAAVFLFIAGATGAVISWDHELDAWLNPALYEARTDGPAWPVDELVSRIEAADPRVRVSYHPLAIEPGHTFVASVTPRWDDTAGALYQPGYNQVALDPATGALQGRREWGAVSLTRENLLPFLYKLHYSMHLPASGGIEWGLWLMGLIAVAWVLDTLAAIVISFPKASQWKRSFSFRWSAGGRRLVFDLHRSGGVWLFLLVLMLAVTSVSMNLNTQVMRPVVEWFSPLTRSPFASRSPAARPIEPRVGRAEVLARAEAEARRRGFTEPAGGVFLSPEFGLWGVGFFRAGHDHGDGGLGNAWLYFDSRTGELAGAHVPGTGSAGDLFLQSMFPLHSGRLLGLPGRVLISALGAAIALFSATGVWLWWSRRVAQERAARGRPRAGAPNAGLTPVA
ncbi:PepSY-associated TM helix domain-containing protein [Ideonella sp. YS5]|uniref:PepSY-associated TM helix domain-containing protein n=1 Tax=Ideonella sp. YS5 TaxID=3453714 RepID=UPI003EEA7967